MFLHHLSGTLHFSLKKKQSLELCLFSQGCICRVGMFGALCGTSAWLAWLVARLCCEDPVSRSTGEIRISVCLALLRAITAPLTKLFLR